MSGSASPLFSSMRLRRMKQRVGRLLIPKLPITRHVFNHLRWEVNASWVTLNNRINPVAIAKLRAVVDGSDLSVNVASGPCVKPGWVNIDLMKVTGVTLRYDCRRGLPFRDGSVARIRCEQFLEHLDRGEEAPLFLRSALRCLKHEGVLRIAVPDTELYLRTYASGDKRDWAAIGWDLDALPAPFQTRIDVINHVFRQEEEHRYAYDFETLERLLHETGFRTVIHQKFGESIDPELRDDLDVHKPFSLYVDAVR